MDTTARESEVVYWCPCGLGWNPRRHKGGRVASRCPACRMGLRDFRPVYGPPAPDPPARPAPIPPFRLPLAPLVARLGAPTDTAARLLLGVWRDDWRDYRERGVTLRVAERLCRHAGLTVDAVWPDWRQERRRHQWRESKRRRMSSNPAARAAHREAQRRYASVPTVREYRRRRKILYRQRRREAA